MKLCIACIYLTQICQYMSTKICNYSNGTTYCCPGYKWNEKLRDCKPCENGFYGKDCNTKCPSNRYGKKCLSECNCTDNKKCHHVFGCTSSTEETIHKAVTTESLTGVASTTNQFSHDSTTSFYEKDFSTASITEEDIQPKELHIEPAMIGIIVLVMVSVILMVLILCTYLLEKQQRVSKSHKESTTSV
ncbi:multiple epidermal growth factor-like domains protein 10 [Crassostrea angulata]|uniref:multiple epidermal growth factor-like domains protein 10 n=1 Tax=Magallana angulata TaxID=2784310 RepID=UPI0022B2066F|nr:multiple epidermal growth factor-like domains protein 10 [Crassostrea angulata]